VFLICVRGFIAPTPPSRRQTTCAAAREVRARARWDDGVRSACERIRQRQSISGGRTMMSGRMRLPDPRRRIRPKIARGGGGGGALSQRTAIAPQTPRSCASSHVSWSRFPLGAFPQHHQPRGKRVVQGRAANLTQDAIFRAEPGWRAAEGAAG
jgi:hypothetical protein